MLGAMVTLTLGTATELGYSTEIKTDCPPIHTICAFPSGVYLGCLYVSVTPVSFTGRMGLL